MEEEEIILPKIIPRNMIEQLLDYLYQEARDEKKSKACIRDIAVIETLFATGLRISELCNLKDKAFDLENGVLCIKGKVG